MLHLNGIDLKNVGKVHHNLSTPELYEEAVKRGEAMVGHLGPLVVSTGKYTARSTEDKFVVREPFTEDILWWGKINKPFDAQDFDKALYGLRSYLQNKDVFVQDGYVGADPEYRINVRLISEHAWHSLFARNMFIREFDSEVIASFVPDYTIVHCPSFEADPEQEHTASEAFVVLNLDRKMAIIGGTSYAGEIRKAIFTLMNYLMPIRGVLSMHASANVGADGDAALFFGESAAGKTTLSTEPDRALLGDDEIGWSDRGLFNYEGGCYAKMIRISDEAEPEIYKTTRRFGTVLENVTIDPVTRRLDLTEAATENTRGAYPITHIDNIVADGLAGHPKHVFLLSPDAFGVLPPIARLTVEQAKYYFMAGYHTRTPLGAAKPEPRFSACFGAPFMPLHPTVYADLLGKKISDHKPSVWLLNTGWTGGSYPHGERLRIAVSRAVIHAASNGDLDNVAMTPDPVFGFDVPNECPGVPDDILVPRKAWDEPERYDLAARMLADLFHKNYRQFADLAGADLAAAGPR